MLIKLLLCYGILFILIFIPGALFLEDFGDD